MGRWFTYKLLEAVAPESIAALERRVPGVKVRQGQIRAPENCAFIVNEIFTRNRVRFTAEADRPEPLILPALPPLANLRPVFANDGFIKEFQAVGVTRYGNRDGAHFHWSPGAGKCLGAILWCLYAGGKTVFVTRAGARRQTAREFHRFTHLTTQVLEGEAAVALDPEAQVYIVGWETLPAHVKLLVKARAMNLVFDELHKGKSKSRWDAIERADGGMSFKRKDNIVGAASLLTTASQRRLGTTGTALADRPQDLWGQLDLVEPGQWGPFCKKIETVDTLTGVPQAELYGFTRRYCNAVVGAFGGFDTKGKPSAEMAAELRERMSGCVYNVPRIVSHGALPEKRREITYISPAEQVHENAGVREFDAAKKRGAVAVLELKLQIACARKRKYIVGRTLEFLEHGEKITIFTGRRKDCDKLFERVLSEVKGTPAEGRVWMAHGDIPLACKGNPNCGECRTCIQDAYMAAPSHAVLIATAQSMGESLNLHDTDRAIFGMLPYNWRELWQWEGRFTRQGQTRKVVIEYPVAERTIDEHIAQILIDKLPAVADIMGDDEAAEAFADLSGESSAESIIANLAQKIFANDDGF